ncbi:peptidase C13 family-domain-containing protein [Gamsiella multidivaricata]|uniref:peptidase C13 family-domain-containing protein n=1 Tax=Gamsiella multidivaricata TaxID=101098 RepID=UPI00221FF2AE|nr:peptidase C13 family-domain-containing protein [Gamsiella multidivaricata]KAG0366774.1 glycosylphosphatidylinositol anchor biosynthesis [Gamsiella multidivaricata]KAI7821319.1 peptidase C13 family-domain-containing protein [Gamsiella multidivaricata]
MKITTILRSLLVGLCIASTLAISVTNNQNDVEGFFNKNKSKSGHTNNWAVLVCTSRFWFNYRHIANTLSMYRTVKRLGIPDSNIIMMLADDVACNSRNIFPATVYNNRGRYLDLYGENVEVDYRGYEVTVENFIRLLTGRVAKETPRSKRLLTDDQSNILVYMTGHGGEEFLKFQDAEEISAYDLGDAFQQMYEKKRYNEILFMIDTCQANTMYTKIHSPNILATGSSKLKESSYSHHDDPDIGVAVIDRFTYYVLEVLEKVDMQSKATLKDLFDTYNFDLLHSTPGVRDDLFNRPLDQVLLTDFFGNVQNVELTESKEKSSFVAESDGVLEESEATILEPTVDNVSRPVQEFRRQEQDHSFEIGDSNQSQTFRYIAFVMLSLILGGALVAGSSMI